MKPFLVLLIVFLLSLTWLKLRKGNYDLALAARTGMAAMLVFTAVGHFLFTKGMTLMLPDFVPFRTEWVYLTGCIEFLAAAGLCIPQLRSTTGYFLIVFFVLLLPANIYAAMKHVDYQNASYDGNGPSYLWFRIPLQALFIVWVYLSAVKVKGSD